ncbi:MAG: hypothetical protein R3233_05840 [Xanthomonadales bacterium]|nr:hypothetical protein [Xanthomonadales bacterium]
MPLDLRSPDWLLAGVDPAAGRAQFARVSRETYLESPFLDHRIRPMPTEAHSLSFDALEPAARAVRGAAGWIVHTAFCCSTLLARCLDHPGRTLVLKEPLVLTRLADLVREGRAADVPLDHLLRLMERAYPGETALIKPSNYANALLPPLMAADARRRVVLMSCALDALLVSLLKKREEAEQRLPGFVAALLRDSDYAVRAGLEQAPPNGVLQLGVVMWHAQRHALETERARLGGRAMVLSMERFLAEPLDTLSAVSAHLDLGLDPEMIERAVSDGAFRRHAKSSETAYDAEQRAQEAGQLATEHADALADARAYAAPLLERVPVSSWPGEETGSGA